MAHNFREMFFIGQNFKHVNILFLNFWFWYLVFISHHTKEIFYVSTNLWETSHEIKTTFLLVSDIDVEKTCFLMLN